MNKVAREIRALKSLGGKSFWNGAFLLLIIAFELAFVIGTLIAILYLIYIG